MLSYVVTIGLAVLISLCNAKENTTSLTTTTVPPPEPTLSFFQQVLIMDCMVCNQLNVHYCCHYRPHRGCCSNTVITRCPGHNCPFYLGWTEINAPGCPSKKACWRRFASVYIAPVCCANIVIPTKPTTVSNSTATSSVAPPTTFASTSTTHVVSTDFTTEVPLPPTNSSILEPRSSQEQRSCSWEFFFKHSEIKEPIKVKNEDFDCSFAIRGVCKKSGCSSKEIPMSTSICPENAGCLSFSDPVSICCFSSGLHELNSSSTLATLSRTTVVPVFLHAAPTVSEISALSTTSKPVVLNLLSSTTASETSRREMLSPLELSSTLIPSFVEAKNSVILNSSTLPTFTETVLPNTQFSTIEHLEQNTLTSSSGAELSSTLSKPTEEAQVLDSEPVLMTQTPDVGSFDFK